MNEAAVGSFLLGFLLTMSNDREVARSLNALVRESHALFGNCDSHALTENTFVEMTLLTVMVSERVNTLGGPYRMIKFYF